MKLLLPVSLALGITALGCTTHTIAGTTGPAAGGTPTSGTSTDTTQVAVGNQVSLNIGGAFSVIGRSVAIRFRTVSQDSRCPLGVQCVQAGDAQILVDVRDPNGVVTQQTLSLSGNSTGTGTGGTTALPNGISMNGVTVTFTALTPVPQNGVTINASQYVATFRVTSP